jgi:hypothetical protein
MSETLEQRSRRAATKYTPENLLPALRLFIKARNKALNAGFTDNGGAIHSVELILDILCQRVCYPGINNLKKNKNAEISVAAHEARECGEAFNAHRGEIESLALGPATSPLRTSRHT